MDELIAKLEAATEGSRELDADIFRVAHPKHPYTHYEFRNYQGRYVQSVNPPDFTTSLDAALTLVGERTIAVLLEALAAAATYFVMLRDKNGHILRRLPIFVCIAALRARATVSRPQATA